ncbi:MAG: patatin-like phospholipase family protein [Pyrinomonadaceae bacterium]
MKRKTIGLALSGGGARGFAHVGVLHALTEHGIPIDFIAGTSAGAFVGGAFASGMSADDIVNAGKSFSWMRVAGISYSPRGLLSNAKIGTFIDKHFPVKNFDEFPIPFAAVACDLETGKEVIMCGSDDIITAIRASCAIPGVFAPVEDENGRLLVDGGVVAPMPMNAIRQFEPDIVIAVDLMACGAGFWGKPRTLVGTLFQSAMLLLRSASRSQHYAADIVIEPQIGHIRPDQMNRSKELFELGKQAVDEMIDEIRKIVLSA